MIHAEAMQHASDRLPSLDGMRGIAALAVVWLHCQGTLFGHYGLASHAYLAVDFFFCLSGFVIAHAYDRRLSSGMPARDFLRARIYRLYPMLFLGVLLGAMAFFVAAGRAGSTATMVATAATLALMPVGLVYGREAFFVNGPMWSLFFEMAANLGYVAKHRATMVSIAAFAAASAAAMIVLTVMHGRMSDMGFLTPSSFLLGFVRVAYPFTAGVILNRLRLAVPFRVHPALPYLALTVLLLAPVGESLFFDLVAVVVVIPAIVAASAKGRQTGHPRILLWLGAISYPLYLLHEPIMRFASLTGVPRMVPQVGETTILAASIGAMVTVSAAAVRYYDEPVRRLIAYPSAIVRNGVRVRQTLV